MKRAFDSISFLKLLETALIVYLIVLGTFLFWVYGKINIAEKRLEADGRINNFGELRR